MVVQGNLYGDRKVPLAWCSVYIHAPTLVLFYQQFLYMKNKILIALVAVALPISVFASSYGVQTKTSGCTANQALPDPACTAGAIFNVSTTTICTVGYTIKVRDVSLSVKKQVFKEYGIDYSLHANYEVDHLISLELGGSNDISNLWPESYLISNGSHTKDSFENYLHSQMCKGNISLTEAQKEIATNWMKYDNLRRGIREATTTADTTSPAVKKSAAGLCHAKGTTYYTATKTFTPYSSVQACLASGGRLPK